MQDQVFSSVKNLEIKEAGRETQELNWAHTGQYESMALPKSEVGAELGLRSAIFNS